MGNDAIHDTYSYIVWVSRDGEYLFYSIHYFYMVKSFCNLIFITFAYLLIDVIVELFVKLSRLLRVLLLKVTFVENQFQKSFPNRKRETFLHYWSCWLTQFPKWLSDIFSNDHICHLHANLQEDANSNGYTYEIRIIDSSLIKEVYECLLLREMLHGARDTNVCFL